MQVALKAYEKAAGYGVAVVTTAATYKIGEIYTDFGKALLGSQRPKGLSGEELEQYNLLLEEQAYPFEERAIDVHQKAINIHKTTAQRVAKGVYDEWVKKSFSRLSKLSPAQYAKNERAERLVDAIQ